MEVNFSNKAYRHLAYLDALNSEKNDDRELITPRDAFFVFLYELKLDDIDKLCSRVALKLHKLYDIDCPIEKVYEICQSGSDNTLSVVKDLIYNTALEMVSNHEYLGTALNKWGGAKSAYLNHVINHSILSGELAVLFGCDVNNAKTRGILHDYGRKYVQDFSHVTVGYEKLKKLCYYDEAVACLTHSFLDGKRCSYCDEALEGFYVDEDGVGRFAEDAKLDDITKFLDAYKFHDYDLILNIADLMAMSNGIVSPYERYADIMTRRSYDPKNGVYFLMNYINVLNKVMCMMEEKYNIPYNDTSVDMKTCNERDYDEILNIFKHTSDMFFDNYLKFKDILKLADKKSTKLS